MSSISPSITNIISDGIDAFTYTTANRGDIWEPPIELECYEWLRVAYPDIFAEFKAVHDVSK